MAQVAMAWIFSKPGVTAPVVGSTKLENLKEIIGKSPIVAFVANLGF